MRDTLINIIAGIDEAIEQVPADSTSKINPRLSTTDVDSPTDVSFDVAFTVSSAAKKEGGGAIKVMAIQVGGGAGSEVGN